MYVFLHKFLQTYYIYVRIKHGFLHKLLQTYYIYKSVATLFRFVARFARARIEDSSRNRFALNGIKGIACLIVFSS